MGFWQSVKDGWNREIVPSPGSTTAESAERGVQVLVALDASDALDAATMHMISRETGYSVEARSENTVTFLRHEGPSAFLGCVLLLFFLVPGILYLVLAGNDLRTTAWVSPNLTTGGCRLLIGGDDPVGQRELRSWAHALPKRSSPEDT